MIGRRLGHYEVLEKVGEGGMGAVYRARDTSVGRDVALKLLPEFVSGDSEKIARLEREAHLLGSMNHPNIAILHGLEESNGLKYLVMELVEGETLAEKLSRGPLPMDEALPIFLQIAEALEEAHHKSIIHRDLKPANVKLTPELRVKVLDFGLAKAMDTAETKPSELSNSPTVARPTAEGVILGTASYMSPEQARGKPIDERTDIWAFACCLFEALTGRKAFDGESATDVLAAIIHKEPDWSAVPRNTPPSIQRLLRRGLEKDLRRRLRDIGDARLDIEEAMTAPVADVPAGGTRGLSMKLVMPVLISLAALAAWALLRDGPGAALPVTRMSITKPPGSGISAHRSLALSPDGSVLAYTSPRGLFLRRLDEFDATLLPETEGASQPFFSPDGMWVGFLVPGALKKVRVSGGAPSTICRVTHVVGMGATWGPDGTIVFSDAPRLHRVSAEGGTPEVLLEAPGPGDWRVTPSFLPDGDRVLFSILNVLQQRLNVLSLRTRETREVPIGTGYTGSPRYLPSGYLLYTESTRLMAVRVDFETLSPRGTAITAVEGVFSPWMGNTAYSVSESGDLAYNALQGGGQQLVKVDREGRTSPILELGREYSVPRVSPDGNRLAVAIFDPTVPRRDIWIYDLLRGSISRLTFSSFDSTDPVWSVDGSRIAFASNRGGRLNVYVKASDAGGEEVEIGEGRDSMMPEQWLPDDSGLLVKCYPRINWDICISRLGDERGTEVELRTEFNELMPSLSPDGRFIAYVSDESGRREVYVRRFRSGQGRWPVSTDGGDEPLFSPDGREIFYRNGDRMMAAAFASEPQVSISPPHVLFEGRFGVDPFNNDARNYDIMPDGQHFVMVRADEEAVEIRVVRNWMEEVKELLPDEK